MQRTTTMVRDLKGSDGGCREGRRGGDGADPAGRRRIWATAACAELRGGVGSLWKKDREGAFRDRRRRRKQGEGRRNFGRWGRRGAVQVAGCADGNGAMERANGRSSGRWLDGESVVDRWIGSMGKTRKVAAAWGLMDGTAPLGFRVWSLYNK